MSSHSGVLPEPRSYGDRSFSVDNDCFGYSKALEAPRPLICHVVGLLLAVPQPYGSRLVEPQDDEQGAAPDRAGISVFWSILSLRPARLVSGVVRGGRGT